MLSLRPRRNSSARPGRVYAKIWDRISRRNWTVTIARSRYDWWVGNAVGRRQYFKWASKSASVHGVAVGMMFVIFIRLRCGKWTAAAERWHLPKPHSRLSIGNKWIQCRTYYSSLDPRFDLRLFNARLRHEHRWLKQTTAANSVLLSYKTKKGDVISLVGNRRAWSHLNSVRRMQYW